MPFADSYCPVLLQAESQQRPTTVLLHGLWAPTVLMRPLQWHLRQRGHRVLLARQRDWARTPASNARALAQWLSTITDPPAESAPGGQSQLHLVGHSLGGVVLLHLMAQLETVTATHASPAGPGVAVTSTSSTAATAADSAIDSALAASLLQRIASVQLLACPCRGSDVARRFAAVAWRARLLGQSVHQGVLGEVPAWTRQEVPLGVIRGTRSRGLGHLLMRTTATGDGVLSLPEADTDVARDRVDLPFSHSGLLFSSVCADHLDRFARHHRYASAGTQ